MRYALLLGIMPLLVAAKASPAVQIGGLVSERDYPIEARNRHSEGDVTVKYTIDSNGRVVDCTEGESGANPVFLTASCKVVGTFRFRPAKGADGKAAGESRRQSFAWRMHSPCPSAPRDVICVNLEMRPKR